MRKVTEGKTQVKRLCMRTCTRWGAKLSKHLRPTAQPRSNARLLPDDRGRSLRRNPVAQRNSQTHVCVLTSELRNLDDPKEDFLAKQYCSKHNWLSVSPPCPATLPDPLCVCVCVCVRSDLFAEWLSVSRTNKPLGSCSPAHLLSALQPLLWVGDLIAQPEVWSSWWPHSPLRVPCQCQGKKKKKTRKEKG